MWAFVFIHVVARFSASFLLPCNIPLYGYTLFYLSVNQLMDTRVDQTFWLLTNNAAVNIHGQFFLWTHIFPSLGYSWKENFSVIR